MSVKRRLELAATAALLLTLLAAAAGLLHWKRQQDALEMTRVRATASPGMVYYRPANGSPTREWIYHGEPFPPNDAVYHPGYRAGVLGSWGGVKGQTYRIKQFRRLPGGSDQLVKESGLITAGATSGDWTGVSLFLDHTGKWGSMVQLWRVDPSGRYLTRVGIDRRKFRVE
jgi:hypothetical protein